jgi:hypothetical protein
LILTSPGRGKTDALPSSRDRMRDALAPGRPGSGTDEGPSEARPPDSGPLGGSANRRPAADRENAGAPNCDDRGWSLTIRSQAARGGPAEFLPSALCPLLSASGTKSRGQRAGDSGGPDEAGNLGPVPRKVAPSRTKGVRSGSFGAGIGFARRGGSGSVGASVRRPAPRPRHKWTYSPRPSTEQSALRTNSFIQPLTSPTFVIR